MPGKAGSEAGAASIGSGRFTGVVDTIIKRNHEPRWAAETGGPPAAWLG